MKGKMLTDEFLEWRKGNLNVPHNIPDKTKNNTQKVPLEVYFYSYIVMVWLKT